MIPQDEIQFAGNIPNSGDVLNPMPFHTHDGINSPKIDLHANNISSSSSSLKMKALAMFEASARYTNTVTGTGAVTLPSNTGLQLETKTTAASYARVLWTIGGFASFGIFNRTPTFSCAIRCQDLVAGSGTSHAFFGLGDPTIAGVGGITFTDDHIGFKFIKSGGVVTLYATQGANAAETTTALTTVVDGDMLDLILQVNNGSVDYYWRKNASTLSSATTLSTNLPTAAQNAITFMVSNVNTAFGTFYIIPNASYER